MLSFRTSTTRSHKILGVIFGALLLLQTAGALFVPTSAGLQVLNRELKMSSAVAGDTVDYTLRFDTRTITNIGSIRLQLCSNSPLYGDVCTPPTGTSFTTATLGTQSGLVGFTKSSFSSANDFVLTRTSSPAGVVTAQYVLHGVKNPDNAGTYYGRIETFTSTDATGTPVDYGGLSFSINGGLNVTATVPPYLLFCAGKEIQPYDCATAQGSYIDFGEFTPNTTNSAQTKFLVGTNAEDGYTVRVLGTTLTSGINTINPLVNPDSSRRGTSQFGLNLRANTQPPGGIDVQGPGSATVASGYGTANVFKFVSGDVLASSTTSDAYRLYTANYIVNVDRNQAPGYYVSTLTYVALASF